MNKLGQCTGSESPLGDSLEAQRILKIIAHADLDIIEHHCGERASDFIRDMREKSAHGIDSFKVTGKQIFFLRDLRDQLLEKGLI
jgi:hypothetical protein